MISSCSRCTLLGFAISTLLHIGVISSILWTGKTPKATLRTDHELALSLAMFEEPSGRDFRATTEIRNGEPSSKPEPVPEPEPASKPAPKPRTEPAPKPAPVPESTPPRESPPPPLPEPAWKIDADSSPKTKSLPAPTPEKKILPKPGRRAEPESETKPTQSERTASRKNRATARSATTKNKTTSGRGAASAKGGKRRNGANAKALERQYLAGLQRAIARNRRYPSRARRKGETGVVRVSFVLTQSGRIIHVRVDKSSGSHALDKAAVETLKRLGRYKPIPQALGRNRWQLRVPIRFAIE